MNENLKVLTKIYCIKKTQETLALQKKISHTFFSNIADVNLTNTARGTSDLQCLILFLKAFKLSIFLISFGKRFQILGPKKEMLSCSQMLSAGVHYSLTVC